MKNILNDINNIDLSDININDFINNWDMLLDKSVEITDDEKYILSNIFSISDIDFGVKKYSDLSAWEKIIFIRFSNIYADIYEVFERNKAKWNFTFTILIDEPDLHLHLDWQKKYIQKLIDVFSTLDKNIKLHFIIATHSPFIISDLPAESIIILEWEWQEIDWKKYTKIKKYENKTFWANFVDIINDWFFFKDKVLMGNFAETNIKDLSSIYKTKILLDSYNLSDDNFKENKELVNVLLKKAKIIKNDIASFEDYENKIKIFEKLEWIKENIWDDFLKENLLYL